MEPEPESTYKSAKSLAYCSEGQSGGYSVGGDGGGGQRMDEYRQLNPNETANGVQTRGIVNFRYSISVRI